MLRLALFHNKKKLQMAREESWFYNLLKLVKWFMHTVIKNIDLVECIYV